MGPHRSSAPLGNHHLECPLTHSTLRSLSTYVEVLWDLLPGVQLPGLLAFDTRLPLKFLNIFRDHRPCQNLQTRSLFHDLRLNTHPCLSSSSIAKALTFLPHLRRLSLTNIIFDILRLSNICPKLDSLTLRDCGCLIGEIVQGLVAARARPRSMMMPLVDIHIAGQFASNEWDQETFDWVAAHVKLVLGMYRNHRSSFSKLMHPLRPTSLHPVRVRSLCTGEEFWT